jgi:hypothetical protein
MKESDFPNEKFLWIPIPKELAYRYWLQFPDKNDADLFIEMPAIIEGALRAIAKLQQRSSKNMTAKETEKQQPLLLEQPYIKQEPPEEVRNYYW